MDNEKAAFDAPARLIIDPPPEWLPVALEWFSSGIASGLEPGSDHFLKPMRDACDTLITCLPAYLCMPFELRTQETEVARLLLELLPTMKHNLDRLTQPHRGAKPDVPHMICAAVVVKASLSTARPHLGARSYTKLASCTGKHAVVPPVTSRTGDDMSWRQRLTIPIGYVRDWFY
jgi:hypothetical protein